MHNLRRSTTLFLYRFWRPSLALASVAAFALAGIYAPAPSLTKCLEGTRPGVRAELMFGRNIGEDLGVSAADFQSFLEREVAPRFPAGFTVSDASGRWRDAAMTDVVKEPSYALVVVSPAAETTASSLKSIAAAYKARFRQQSVLVALSATCFAL